MAKQSLATPEAPEIVDAPEVDPLAGFPEGLAAPAATVIQPSAPDASEYSGLFKRGEELFMMATGPADSAGRTHFLKNKLHFCHVTREDFLTQFEKQ